MARTHRIVLAAVVLTVFVAGCAKEEKGEGLARAGGKTITSADLDKRMETMPPFMRQQLSTPDGRKRLLDGMIEEEVVYKDALATGLDKDAEFKAEVERTTRDLLIRRYFDKVIEAKAVPTEDEVKQYYDANPDEFKIPESVTARHILTASRDEAVSLRRQTERGASFAELASKHSTDMATRANGGLIGAPVVRGQSVKGLGAVPELVDAAFGLNEGEVSQPVKTAKGYHLILVEKRTPEGTKGLDQARDDIVSKLSYNKRKAVREETMNALKSKYKVIYLSGSSAEARTPEDLFKMASEAPNPREKTRLYQQFAEKYPKHQRAYEAKFMVGFTLAEEIKDYDQAEKVFRDFLREYPSSDLSDDAQWMLDNMRSGKEPEFKTD